MTITILEISSPQGVAAFNVHLFWSHTAFMVTMANIPSRCFHDIFFFLKQKLENLF